MKILATDGLAKEAEEYMKKNGHEVDSVSLSPEDLKKNISMYDGIIVRSKTKLRADTLEMASNLKIIGRAGIGVDNIDIKKAAEMGIPVVNSPTASTHSVAELTLGGMISVSRHIHTADRSIRGGKWEKSKFKGMELHGKTLGLIGYGRIARHLAKLCTAFDMRIIAYDPYLSRDAIESTGAKYTENVMDIASESDYVSVHVPLTDSTRGIVGEKFISSIKNGAVICNYSRGGVVDEKALLNGLDSGKISGAALDVYEKEPLSADSPLLKYDNIVFTPHIGASTKEGQLAAGMTIAEQFVDFFMGKDPKYKVN